jgi:hypothetical protein
MSAFNVDEYFDVTVNFEGDNIFMLTPLNNDTYQLYGHMYHPDQVWVAEGCKDDLEIEWNLTMYPVNKDLPLLSPTTPCIARVANLN